MVGMVVLCLLEVNIRFYLLFLVFGFQFEDCFMVFKDSWSFNYYIFILGKVDIYLEGIGMGNQLLKY